MTDQMHQDIENTVDAQADATTATLLVRAADIFDKHGCVKNAALLRKAADILMRDEYTPPVGYRLVPVADGQQPGTGPKHYLSGPMSGYPDNNYPAFHTAAAALRAQGINVVSPAEIAPQAANWEGFMRADIKALCDCKAIVLMPGWEASAGAHMELNIAHRLGLRILTLHSLLPDPQPYDQGERAYVAATTKAVPPSPDDAL